MKTVLTLALLVPLLGACGDPEPTPQPSGNEVETPTLTEEVQSSESVAPSAANDHPHPEWADIEIDVNNIVAQIDPEPYVENIREALLHHGTKEDPIPIDTDFLGAWGFDETKPDPFPPHVRAVAGKYIIVKGFMLPDVDFRGIKKFHLVRSLWGCCFGAPPRLNELLTISTPDDEGMEYTYNTLEVIGRLEVVFETEDGLINDLYRLRAESIVEGEYDDPLAPEGANPEEFLPGVLGEMEF